MEEGITDAMVADAMAEISLMSFEGEEQGVGVQGYFAITLDYNVRVRF